MKTILFIIISFSAILLLQSCQCHSGWGYSTISNNYFPQKSWSDTTHYYLVMREIGINNSEIMIDSSEVNNYFKNKYFSVSEKEQVFYLKKQYPLYPLINCPFGNESEICIHSWYLKSKKQDVIFEFGLYYGGFALNHIYLLENDNAKAIGVNDLCDMKYKDRNRLRKLYIKRFEEEILQLMKPYFTK